MIHTLKFTTLFLKIQPKKPPKCIFPCTLAALFLLYRSKSPFQIFQKIFNMLRPHRQPDRILADSLFLQFFFCQLGMRRRGGMDHQAFHIRYISQQRKNLQMINKSMGLLLSTFISKVKIDPPPLGKYFSYNL